jgi:HK97 family phage major capsid protein
MALKTLMLKRQIDLKKKALGELNDQLAGFATREAELEQAISEVENDEQRNAVESEISAFETERSEAQTAADQLTEEIRNLESELENEEAQQTTEPAAAGTPAAAEPAADENRGGYTIMNRRFRDFNLQEREAFLANEQVRSFLGEVRSAMAEKRALSGVGLTIPEVMLGLIREEMAAASKLLRFVDLRSVAGKGRQNVMGKISEGVWTEMCANLNELNLAFNQIEVDGYKVGGFVVVCNAVLEDSDIALANEIITAIGKAIAKALDKAILFGDGSKKPVGIATRLAASSSPAWWGANEPAFTDLHTSNIQTINVNAQSGAAFFIALLAKLGIAKPKYSGEGLFWAMNRKTHLDILAKALAVNANGAYVAGTNLMPIIGGEVVEFDDDEMQDYEIIGGFGGNYLLAERAGIEFDSSKEFLFTQDQTVFKGTARYDGRPTAGEAFVIVNYNNTSPTTSATFADDDANSVQDIRLNTHTGAISGTGTLKLKAITEPGKGTVTWATGDSDIATVSSAGLVTGVSAGTAVITATCNGLTDSCTVTVS